MTPTVEHRLVTFKPAGRTEVDYMLTGTVTVREDISLIYKGATLNALGVMHTHTEENDPHGLYPHPTRCFAVSLIGTEFEGKAGPRHPHPPLRHGPELRRRLGSDNANEKDR